MNEPWLDESDMHWAYFLSLEEDMNTLSRFIEITQDNFSTYSLECTRLLLASCSEAEVVLKLCAGLDRRKYLKDCFLQLGSDVNTLLESEVTIRRAGLKIRPWQDWSESNPPTWWKAYNSIKHDRSNNYREASLENACHALSGLFCVALLYLRRKGSRAVFPSPRMLKISGDLGTHCMSPEGAFINLNS